MITLVKICGLSTPDTLDAALEAGADMVGFVFHPASPRHVELAHARGLASRIEGRARLVALVVDADDATLAAIAAAVRPDLWQAHGRETPARVTAIAAATGVPVMKAVGVATAADVAALGAYEPVSERLLVDAKPAPGAPPGGNGVAFDWGLVAGLETTAPWLLSGGLTAATVGEALARTGAGGVDVSSGVERARGVKDAALIAAFVAAVRHASRPVESSVYQALARDSGPGRLS